MNSNYFDNTGQIWRMGPNDNLNKRHLSPFFSLSFFFISLYYYNTIKYAYVQRRVTNSINKFDTTITRSQGPVTGSPNLGIRTCQRGAIALSNKFLIPEDLNRATF